MRTNEWKQLQRRARARERAWASFVKSERRRLREASELGETGFRK